METGDFNATEVKTMLYPLAIKSRESLAGQIIQSKESIHPCIFLMKKKMSLT